MTGKTHDLAAFTALTLVIIALPQVPEMSFATAVVAFGANFAGGLFPDIDQPTSDLWDNFRFGPFVAKLVCPALGGHRHISHSLIGLILIAVVADVTLTALSGIVLIDMNIVWWSFMIGVVSHLVTDLFTKAGLPLFWPAKIKIGVPPVKWLRIEAGNWVENWLLFPSLFLYAGYLLIHHQDRFLALLK